MKRYKIVLNSTFGTEKEIFIEASSENDAVDWVNLIINENWAIYSVIEVSK